MWKKHFLGPSRGRETLPLGPLFFFSLVYVFIFCSFSASFSISFHVFPLFFLCFFLVSNFYSIIFLFCFPFKKCFFLFSFCFSFFFSRVLKICGCTSEFLGEKCTFWAGFICFVLARRHFTMWNSAHSGDGQVESRIWWAAGGARIATFVPSMRRLTHLSLVSSLFSSPSHFCKYLSLFSRKHVLAVPSRVFLRAAHLFSQGIMHILKRHSVNFHFLSFSFIFFHFSFFFLSSCCSSFLGCSKSFFVCLDRLTISQFKLLCKKKHFFGPSRGRETLHWALFFFSLVLFFSFFFIFVLLFQFLSMLSFFPLFFPFPIFIPLFSFFVFLLKNVSSFFILFLFFLFSGAQNLVACTSGFLGEKCTFWAGFICFVLARRHFTMWNSAHSWWWSGGESFLVGGGWVKSYLRTRIARLVPSMRRLTHLGLVSSLFSSPSHFCKYLSLFSRKLVLAVPSRVFLRAAHLFS